MPGLQDVNTDLQINTPQINVDIDRKQASAVGVSVSQIQTALGDAFGTRQISTIYTSTNEYQVILEVKPEYQYDPAALGRLYVRSSTGNLVPLATVATLLAVMSHPFLDWLTTYAIAIFAPVSWRWYSGNAIFIIDWVYWVLMITGIAWSSRRWRHHLPNPGRPAQVAGVIMLAYIAFNLGESARIEQRAAEMLRQRGIEPTLIVAGPPPIAFWERNIQWRSDRLWGSGDFDLQRGLTIDSVAEPLRLDDPALAEAIRRQPHIKAYMVWSRMPVVIRKDGHSYLIDQRFYGPLRSRLIPGAVRHWFRGQPFLVPLDKQ